MKILRALIYAEDDIQPHVDWSTKRIVSIDLLRRRNVLLLISGLDISQEELSILEQIHSESKLQTKRQEIHHQPCHCSSVSQPSLIHDVVIRFVKERWHFRNKPILVVLDLQGKVVCPNDFHIMWICGSNAFPFTTLKEEALCKDEMWQLELLVNGTNQNILNWVISTLREPLDPWSSSSAFLFPVCGLKELTPAGSRGEVHLPIWRGRHIMDPQVHDGSMPGDSGSKDPAGDGQRWEEHQEGAGPASDPHHHHREPEQLLEGLNADMVLQDMTGERAINGWGRRTTTTP
ncbi:hypothetical protein MLD38_001627 [Melastoma candidum]|uniref:Uncharacterized protein n=1 Tax=Melastoma candidum TaxID=119954 RepID=A0ACB9SDS4_9MYRT|nr:hypothetical protein MLD38_001627 [Melastoma candidum]